MSFPIIMIDGKEFIKIPNGKGGYMLVATKCEPNPNKLKAQELVDDEGKSIKGIDNVQTIVNPVQNNKIVTKPSASSKEKADSIGRGNTQPIQFYDELVATKCEPNPNKLKAQETLKEILEKSPLSK